MRVLAGHSHLRPASSSVHDRSRQNIARINIAAHRRAGAVKPCPDSVVSRHGPSIVRAVAEAVDQKSETGGLVRAYYVRSFIKSCVRFIMYFPGPIRKFWQFLLCQDEPARAVPDSVYTGQSHVALEYHKEVLNTGSRVQSAPRCIFTCSNTMHF